MKRNWLCRMFRAKNEPFPWVGRTTRISVYPTPKSDENIKQHRQGRLLLSDNTRCRKQTQSSFLYQSHRQKKMNKKKEKIMFEWIRWINELNCVQVNENKLTWPWWYRCFACCPVRTDWIRTFVVVAYRKQFNIYLISVFNCWLNDISYVIVKFVI